MDNQKNLETLYFCAAQCAHCYNACQIEKDKEKLQRCMMLDKDCEDLCRLTAQLLERGSGNAELFLKLCAEICERCASECEKHAALEHCKRCAEACRKCAEMCHDHQPVH